MSTQKPDILHQLEASHLRLSNAPILRVQGGNSFVPRAGIFSDEICIAVICAFSNSEMEMGLTSQITNAQSVVTTQTVIHLRPHTKTALVGVRNQNNGFHYHYAPKFIGLGGCDAAVSELCALLPVVNREGWNDFPLSGNNLPVFVDMESFLSWWDFYPGKQSFEIISGQVHLAQGFPNCENGPPGFRRRLLIAANDLKPKHLSVYSGLLVRMGTTTAICPDLVFCEPPTSDDPFVSAKASVLFIRPNWTDEDIRVRVDLLSNVGSKVALLDTNTHEFTGQFGTETERLMFEDHEVKLKNLIHLALS